MDMLGRARAKFGQMANADFQQLDLMADPLPEGPFDLISASNALEHFPEPGAVVNKAWARLRPGGYMVLLFGVESGTLSSRLVAWIECVFLGAHLLREDEYRHFPGLISVQRFNLPLVLIVMHKPEQTT